MRRLLLVTVALATSCGGIAPSVGTAHDQRTATATAASRRMPDGKQWTTSNLDVAVRESYCYGNSDRNCTRYGRLYTWDAARHGCGALGDGWRLPSDAEWRQLAKQYGGVRDDSRDAGRSAYDALLSGGRSNFNAALGGSRAGDGEYSRIEAHGFYWTGSESNPSVALFYNFAAGSRSFNRQSEGDKRMAASVRCIKD